MPTKEWVAYKEAIAPIEKVYDKAMARAMKRYGKALDRALLKYKRAKMIAWECREKSLTFYKEAYREAYAKAKVSE